MSQAFTGNGYIQNIINGEVTALSRATVIIANRWYRWKPGAL